MKTDHPHILDSHQQQAYWQQRYTEGRHGWDIGHPTDPLRAYLDQVEDRSLRILIPGAGNAYEAEYAWKQGFRRVYVLDIAAQPLADLAERVPDFPPDHLLHENFFAHRGTYDLMLEQTFFCSFPPTPENRTAYFRQAYQLLRPGGKLVGLFFATEDVGRPGERPFGGTREEYLRYLNPYFDVRTLERAHNSIKPRLGRELFAILPRRGESVGG
jgi:thiopurine S-methyltransferase